MLVALLQKVRICPDPEITHRLLQRIKLLDTVIVIIKISHTVVNDQIFGHGEIHRPLIVDKAGPVLRENDIARDRVEVRGAKARLALIGCSASEPCPEFV